MIIKAGGRLAIVFLLAVILLIANAVISYQSVSTLIANNQLVNHTQEVLDGLQDLRAHLLQVETDARGYLLTSDPVYLESYRANLTMVWAKINRLKQQTADNRSQQEKFPELEAAVRARLELLQEYVDRREVLGATVIPAGQSAEGKARMDRVRGAIASISDDERGLLVQRVGESERSGQRTLLTFLLANAVLFTLVSLVFYLALRDIKERQLNVERLAEAKSELEQRVLERTADLNALNTELERSNRELQDFAFVASHDLQEPLRKIQAFGDRLRTVQGPKFDDQGRDYLDRMHKAAGRMHTLINDLLTFSRVTTKAQPFGPTDLDKVVEDVLSDLETTIEQSGGAVAAADLPTIDADGVQMRQLFQNLIANALKFKKPDSPPRVSITSETFQADATDVDGSVPRDLVRLSVKDNGIGFDEKYLDRIFTPFQRLHGRNEYEGTGIGLAVCRKIVERHGGTLTAKSTPGEGSTFIATLPVTQKEDK